MSSPSKFSSIHDAAQYVNDELQRRAILPAPRRLLFHTVDDLTLEPQLTRINNDKLIINTIHKLLKKLDEAENPESRADSPKDLTPTLNSPPTIRGKLNSDKKVVKSASRQTQVALRRHEVILEQLRAKLKHDGPDLTWFTRPIPRSHGIEQLKSSNDTTTILLQNLISHKTTTSAALDKIVDFLQSCNGFLYTRCVHDCECQVPSRVDLRFNETNTSLKQLDTDDNLGESLLKLQELLNDWHDIAKLIGNDEHS
ncbi:LANO_0C05204g1_1 [Lachancea nothofagi CBS 11611]|uniref:LANO_0C05204g1_1 n=1 Tax=Lachancea nothofagi CBS 11611 TaxID=1266666 RepID=A0A1G4J7H7_9SACH|nr:LANO_0C05204g1_1 [Lachancea nothofagi CBS 11611]